MKRPAPVTDSFMPICPSADEDGVDGRDFSLMDGLDDGDGDCGGVTAAVSLPREKKRRLRVELVRALERSFEVENKLGPERKVRLAQELGHQPRQIEEQKAQLATEETLSFSSVKEEPVVSEAPALKEVES
ncbi:hypothetical protein OPV22_006482 [Ensete ventricosum]|uniref:Homeobox-leucine zipper protein n=1 Tax=Ensete ventricosum TaxID=4639 RepID=A0AAV8RKY0_ENSVE|nr:hypothetical protein OPV22_006482 [Ensete ventricosum]